MRHRQSQLLLAAMPALLLAGLAAAPAQAASGDPMIERGRYVVRTSGCNDCHTAGYAEKAGLLAESLWLTGDQLGWRGPWGTTYPANLRIYMANITEKEWVAKAQSTPLRPPMPWFNLRDMKTEDLQAIYRFVRHLGPAGKPAPAYVPPGVVPNGPFVQFPAPPN